MGLISIAASSAVAVAPSWVPCRGRKPQPETRLSDRERTMALDHDIDNPVGNDNHFSRFLSVKGLAYPGQGESSLPGFVFGSVLRQFNGAPELAVDLNGDRHGLLHQKGRFGLGPRRVDQQGLMAQELP